MTTTFGVVGGGIVGLAVARELTIRHPGADIERHEITALRNAPSSAATSSLAIAVRVVDRTTP